MRANRAISPFRLAKNFPEGYPIPPGLESRVVAVLRGDSRGEGEHTHTDEQHGHGPPRWPHVCRPSQCGQTGERTKALAPRLVRQTRRSAYCANRAPRLTLQAPATWGVPLKRRAPVRRARPKATSRHTTWQVRRLGGQKRHLQAHAMPHVRKCCQAHDRCRRLRSVSPQAYV